MYKKNRLINFLKSIIPLLLFAGLPATLLSQSKIAEKNSISGMVRDSANHEPAIAATVMLFNSSSHQHVAATLTDENGRFVLNNLSAGVYTLQISYIGFETLEKSPISLAANQTLSLGNLVFSSSAKKTLMEVVVKGNPPAMRLDLDRKVFNPEQSIISKGGSATDLLSNIPTLAVDADGNVSMRGVSSVRVLIDGKPSSLAGNNIGAYLQSLPANAVERVELLTNPSPKYDPEGQGGVINIIMKKNARQGLNGTLTAGAGSYGNYNAGLDINYQHKKMNYYVGYDVRKYNNPGNGYNSNRYNDGSSVYNTSESQWKGINHSIRLGTDYNLDEKNTLNISSNINFRDIRRPENFFYTFYNADQSILGTSQRNTNSERNSKGADIGLDYKHQFKREGETLSANFAFGQNKEDGNQIFIQSATSDAIHIDRNRLNNTDNNNKNINIQLDYVLPLKNDQKLETGYRSTLQYNTQQQLSDTLNLDNEYHSDYALTNNFRMNNIVHALYVNYQRKFGKKYNFQAGLRAEQAYLNTAYINLDPDAPGNGANGRLNYFRVYPGVFLSRKLNDDATLQVSYTRRVNRPNGWQITPFLNISDPVNYWQGNPNLRPEDVHSFELGYTNHIGKVNITSSLYHRITNDIIQSIIDSAAVGNNVTYSTFRNIGRNNTTGIEIITQIILNNKLDFLVNGNANYQSFSGSSDHNISFNSGFSWDANATINWKIVKPLSFQLRGGYSAPRITAQGTTFYNITSDAALRWSVLKDKGNISFNTRNILNKGARWGATRDLAIMQSEFLRNWMKGPQFGLTFNYRFGINKTNAQRRRSLIEESAGGSGGA